MQTGIEYLVRRRKAMTIKLTPTWIHIPKTAGTALKNAEKSQQKKLNISLNHQNTLFNTYDCIFAIRDPWERFCSGYWECKTNEQRAQLAQTVYANMPHYGYGEFTQEDKNILANTNTPEEYFVWLLANPTYKVEAPQPGLHNMTCSLDRWLGDLTKFKKYESRVNFCFDVKDLTYIMKHQFNIDMPTDPFLKRSRELFDTEQSYNISPENLELFKTYRQSDYELLEYIRKQPYYQSD